MIELQHLNALPVAEFVDRLAGIFEHSPWVAARTASGRPFASRDDLLAAMRRVVDQASAAEQLTLIRAHPPLGSGGRKPVALTAASAREQRGAGLQASTPQESAQLARLNAAYEERFGMPFILAVRGHDPKSIIANVEVRLANAPAIEQAAAVREIGLIAEFRLADAVTDTLPVPVIHHD